MGLKIKGESLSKMHFRKSRMFKTFFPKYKYQVELILVRLCNKHYIKINVEESLNKKSTSFVRERCYFLHI